MSTRVCFVYLFLFQTVPDQQMTGTTYIDTDQCIHWSIALTVEHDQGLKWGLIPSTVLRR